MTERIATFTQSGQIINNNMRLQSAYAERQIQVSSGLKSRYFDGLAFDTTRLLSLESDLKGLQQQTENAQIALDRINLMFSAVANLVTQTDTFLADLQVTSSGLGITGADLVNNAQSRLDQFAGGLNTRVQDRYLFAGSNTRVAPVDFAGTGWTGQAYVPPGPSVADASYYTGNDYIQTVEAFEGFNVDYGVTANNSAFEQIIRGYGLVITDPNNIETAQEAYRVMQLGQEEMQIIQAQLSQRAQTLEQQIRDNEEEINVLEEQISNISDVDIAEATTNLRQLENQLEASFSVTATLLNLKLSDYFR
jgi:flagellar hook-associated protein 3 FlgL